MWLWDYNVTFKFCSYASWKHRLMDNCQLSPLLIISYDIFCNFLSFCHLKITFKKQNRGQIIRHELCELQISVLFEHAGFSSINHGWAFRPASVLHWKPMYIQTDSSSNTVHPSRKPSLSPHIVLRLSSVRTSLPSVKHVAVCVTLIRAEWTSEAVRLACAVDYLSSDGVIFCHGLHVLFMALGTGCDIVGFYCAGRLKMLNSDQALWK